VILRDSVWLLGGFKNQMLSNNVIAILLESIDVETKHKFGSVFLVGIMRIPQDIFILRPSVMIDSMRNNTKYKIAVWHLCAWENIHCNNLMYS
jgi:hypothetical protein